MNLGRNLQTIRKARQLSQEELADKMDVSRQAISKWESGAAYPETEKLIELSKVLDCSLDSLVKGEVQDGPKLSEKAEYDTLMDRFSKQMSLAVMLVLMGSSILLGMSALGEKCTDYGLVVFLLFVAVSVPIFVMRGIELGNYKQKYPRLENFYTEKEIDAYNVKFTRMIAGAIGILMVGLVVFMALVVVNLFGKDNAMSAAVFMLFVTAAVPMFVYAGIQKSKYDIEQYNKENSIESQLVSEKMGKVAGVIMMLATIIFLLLGFLGKMWALAWLVYPVGGILCGIASVILRKTEK